MRRLPITLAALLAFGSVVGLAELTSASSPSDVPVVGDVDCSGDLNAFDALTVLRHDAGLGVNTPPGCPTLEGASHPVSAAISDLALRLGVNPVNIAVDEVRQAIWADACLGVHRRSCLQIVTEGYWINLESQGTDYTYHTTCSGPTVVAIDFLDPGTIVDPPPGNIVGACH